MSLIFATENPLSPSSITNSEGSNNQTDLSDYRVDEVIPASADGAIHQPFQRATSILADPSERERYVERLTTLASQTAPWIKIIQGADGMPKPDADELTELHTTSALLARMLHKKAFKSSPKSAESIGSGLYEAVTKRPDQILAHLSEDGRQLFTLSQQFFSGLHEQMRATSQFPDGVTAPASPLTAEERKLQIESELRNLGQSAHHSAVSMGILGPSHSSQCQHSDSQLFDVGKDLRTLLGGDHEGEETVRNYITKTAASFFPMDLRSQKIASIREALKKGFADPPTSTAGALISAADDVEESSSWSLPGIGRTVRNGVASALGRAASWLDTAYSMYSAIAQRNDLASFCMRPTLGQDGRLVRNILRTVKQWDANSKHVHQGSEIAKTLSSVGMRETRNPTREDCTLLSRLHETLYSALRLNTATEATRNKAFGRLNASIGQSFITAKLYPNLGADLDALRAQS